MNKLTGLVLPVLQRFKNFNPLKLNLLKHFLLWQENEVITGIMLRVYTTVYDTKFLDFMQLETFTLNSVSPCHLTGSLTCWDKEELWKKTLTCWRVSNMHVHKYGRSNNCNVSQSIDYFFTHFSHMFKCSISKLSVTGEFSMHSVVVAFCVGVSKCRFTEYLPYKHRISHHRHCIWDTVPMMSLYMWGHRHCIWDTVPVASY